MGQISSDVTTDQIRVKAVPTYRPEHSSQDENRYVFSYQITFHNKSEIDVTLKSRCWSIINAEGEEHEVRGFGVVGETPTLGPGDFYEYESFSVLDTPFGTMEGYYIFERADGDVIKAEVARFYLATNAEIKNS